MGKKISIRQWSSTPASVKIWLQQSLCDGCMCTKRFKSPMKIKAVGSVKTSNLWQLGRATFVASTKPPVLVTQTDFISMYVSFLFELAIVGYREERQFFILSRLSTPLLLLYTISSFLGIGDDRALTVPCFVFNIFIVLSSQNVEGESILGTKKRRIIMLSDMLLCVSLIKG